MRALLLADNVPDYAIQCEDQSTSTFENIRFAKKMIGDTHAVIVTDSYHAKRALMVARHVGLNAEADCPPMPHFPLRQHLREACARLAYARKFRRMRSVSPPNQV